jgi:transposase-like protein
LVVALYVRGDSLRILAAACNRSFLRMTKLSTEQRWKIVHTMKQAQNVAGTSKIVGCTKKAVRRWWKRYQDTGEVADEHRTGRKPILSKQVSKQALKMLLDESNNGATDVAKELAAKGLTDKVVNKLTVIRAARRAALQKGEKLCVRRGKPPKFTTQATKMKRTIFAKENKNRAWDNVVFTDRKRFYFKYPGSKVKPVRWVLGGSRSTSDEVFQPKNPQCLNIYAGISKHGMRAVHVVAGSSKHTTGHVTKRGTPTRNITSSQYKEVLKKTLLPGGHALLAGRCEKWFLQQDNDPSHACAKKVVETWGKLKGSNVELLPNWPPNSPDLNIIENVWAWCSAEVNKLGCQSFDEFKQAVLKTVSEVPKGMITKLYASLSERMKLVIKNKGGHTGY